MTDKYPWMNDVCYEPAPTIEPAHPAPIPLFWRIFLIVAVLVVIGGGLAALAT